MQAHNNTDIYILSTSAVSPQSSFPQMMSGPAVYDGERMRAIDPDYTQYIDPKQIRRMSRVIKMGVAAAMECLKQAGLTMPDAIITGTAYGCLADTDQFLTRLVEFNEELLSPTAFIQSTHNTVGAQIALMLGCHNYNNTYVHRGSSFEAALTDALSLLQEEAETVLLGGIDEIIDNSHAILRRFDQYKKEGHSATLIGSGTKGTMGGEGAAFFALAKEKQPGAIAKLEAFTCGYKSTSDASCIPELLTDHHISSSDIDTIITGKNGDAGTDAAYNAALGDIPVGKNVLTFKQYCGEYPTASSFALWMATCLIQQGSAKKILIYNNYKQQYPALYVVAAC